MSWVSIDYDKCTGCGICAEGCPRCFQKNGKEIEVHADENCCALCGHCVSLCPAGAISHHEMDMENFTEISKAKLIDTDVLIQFIRERRTHRHFTKQSIPKKDLETLVDTVRYAPTGGNSQSVEIILVQNPARRKKLSDLAVDHIADGIADFAGRLKELREGGDSSPEEIRQLEGMIRFREMLAKARDAGRDPVFYEAPAVAIFHSTTETVTPKDNCVIASTTMGLLARTLGLETTYIALFENAVNSYPPLREELKLPEKTQVYSVLVIGYPRYKYHLTVDRKPMRVRWE